MTLATAWLEAQGPQAQAVLALRPSLIRLLEEAISSGADTGIGLIEGSPRVLALDGDFLVVLDLTVVDIGQISEDVTAIPLTPKPSLKISGRTDLGSPADPGQQLTRTRTWTITTNTAEQLTVQTLEVIQAPFSSDAVPDSGEKLMRVLARQVGWPGSGPLENP